MTAVRLVLLVLAVLGAVLRPFRLPAFVAPVACCAIAFASGAVSFAAAGHDLRPLVDPLAFLLAAIPLAVLLDQLGYFQALADRVTARRKLLGGLWLLAVATVAVLNLDAAVVLLTPLYVRIARGAGLDARYVGFQPVILALLASSFLPVSNLTNLIAADRTGVDPLAFLEHLGLPGAAACLVGYACYRATRIPADRRAAERPSGRPGSMGAPISADRGAAERPSGRPGSTGASGPADERRAIAIGSVVVAVVLVGFVAGPSAGIQPWMVALGADVVLIAVVRHLPFNRIPWATALVAAGLAVLAAAAAATLPLASLLQGTSPLATLRIAAATAAGANVVNNLPALLVSLSFVAGKRCVLWPALLGVNAGPSLLVTGSLASLLWAESMRHLGEPVRAGQFLRMGLRVGLPAFAAALAVLVAMGPIFGC
jgi:arsenical pump membrane protein